MRSRQTLQDKLEKILGTGAVYFQPPESKTLTYPCIVFELNDTDVTSADNRRFITYDRYHIKHLYKSINNCLKNTILDSFDYISHDNQMKVDGLYNDDFTLYY